MKPNENTKADAQEFRQLRCRLGLTQKALARRLRMSQSAVSHWEMGITYPSVRVIGKLMKLAAKEGFTFKNRYVTED